MNEEERGKFLACVQTSPISFVARGKGPVQQRKWETSARRQSNFKLCNARVYKKESGAGEN